jgi:hypothetical protein
MVKFLHERVWPNLSQRLLKGCLKSLAQPFSKVAERLRQEFGPTFLKGCSKVAQEFGPTFLKGC